LFLREAEPGAAQYLRIDSDYFEVFISPILTSDGFEIGSLAAGGHFSSTALDDLRRLTGFDVVISDGSEVIGHTISPTVNALLTSGYFAESGVPQDEIQKIRAGGIDIMSLTLASQPFNATITFLGSPGEWLAPIERRISWLLLLLATAGGLAAMAAIYAVTERRIGRQVNLLVRGAEQIAEGNLDSRIEALSHDELGYLAREFETMRGRLKQQRLQLEQEHAARLNSERHAAIGRLATGIIHDFKNPMTIIRGNVDLIELKQAHSTSDVSKYYRNIKAQIERMGQLARDILEFSKGRVQLDLADVAIGDFLNEIMEGQGTSFERAGLQLRLDGDPSQCVRFDRLRLRRVVDNLLSNACEALHPGGRVTVKWQAAGEAFSLEISDNGPGIPAEIRDHLFEPFVTHGKKHGTGLGLAISHKIVEDHGGTLTVESDPSWGTRFVIALPLRTAVEALLQGETA
jgi:signal transduction histidine kinase